MKKLLIISILFISLFGCRIVKKEYLEENYVEKTELKQLEQDIIYSNERLKTEISTSIALDYNEKIKQATEKTSSNESETTTVSGSIEAEEGKEKSVTVGNTTIKSNGANVSFETTNTKALSKEFESKYNELDQKYSLLEQSKKLLEIRLDSINTKLTDFEKNYNSEKTTKSKLVTKKQLAFGFVLLLIFIGAYLLLRKKFAWLP